jgi:hypothetical protein
MSTCPKQNRRGGHCLPKDIRYVTSMAPSQLLESAIDVDKKYREWLSKKK